MLLSLVLTLTACSAAPAPQAPPASNAPPAATAVTVDTRCRTDADCTVKDIGNCCGAFPACVNVNSATDPQGVMARCQASGQMSVCGFQQISGCQCVAGKCAAKPAQADTLRRPDSSHAAVQ
ncbi:hypothetical protein [Xanthomonas maliensis]|uniref:hypothetical protein n=1 Tax=Xanthomonas maliensis TaxID=1321368 RepID=UPI0004CE871F|nr:hypothetical protein [Xanthomonas maliensis]KAB7765216.1 hypothetical protein CKY51_16140 [Xanthomonas maliensis]